MRFRIPWPVVFFLPAALVGSALSGASGAFTGLALGNAGAGIVFCVAVRRWVASASGQPNAAPRVEAVG